MTHKRGIKAVTDGIKTKKQREPLRSMGRDYWQGHLCSAPIPKNKLAAMLPE